MNKKEKVSEVISRLEKVYPEPKTALTYTTPLELLIATILSAQTTDTLVNTVTPALFAKYTTAKAFAEASYEEVDALLSKVNFHRNKAKHIQAACKIIYEQYGGNVPDTMEKLDALPGVARKTANVVLGTIFNKPEGIAVDTHVMRLSRKLGFTDEHDPVKIEQDLMKIVPKEKWISFSHLLILHGREMCTARQHSCEKCPLEELCPDHEVSQVSKVSRVSQE